MNTSQVLQYHKEEEFVFNRQKTIIVEFVGPPGAGKTTNCSYFLEQLKKKHVKVCSFEDIKSYVQGMSFAQKAILSLQTLLQKGKHIFLYACVLAYCGVYSLNSIYRYIKLSAYDVVLESFIRKHAVDVMLLDQWVIQGIWSATIFKSKSLDKAKDHLKRFYFNTDFVFYFDVDVETASHRMQVRKTSFSRFDRMDPEMRVRELKKYNSYLHKLFENSECSQKYTFSAMHKPADNFQYFIQYFAPLTEPR